MKQMPREIEEQRKRWEDWVKKKIEFYIISSQWDNITMSRLDSWLHNFGEQGLKYAFALLNHFIFYPERDVKRLCAYSLNNVVFKGQLTKYDQTHGFSDSNKTMRKVLEGLLDETRIVPIWSEGNPSESGNMIARYFTTRNIINQSHVLRPDQILPVIYRRLCKRFLFVDDFLGSGDQIKAVWNGLSISVSPSGDKVSLRSLAEAHNNIAFEYVALVASSPGLEEARSACPGLKFHCCEELTSEYRVFDDNSIFFPIKLERETARTYLEDLCGQKKIPFLGYKGLDFAVAFQHGAPDGCLPLFWEQNSNWNQLVNRRM